MMRVVRDEEELLLNQARFQETLEDYRQKLASYKGPDPVQHIGRETYSQLIQVMEGMLTMVEEDLERLRK